MNPRSALLVGATGLTGRFCLQALLNHPAWDMVIVLARRPVSVPGAGNKLVQTVTEFDHLEQLTLPHIDDVFCALGTTIRKAASQEAFRRVDFEFPLAAARLGLKSGARRFVLVSSAGANARSRNFYLRTKGELEDAVSALPLKAVHIFRPSLLLGERDERRPGEAVGTFVGRLFQFAMVGPLRRYHPVSADRVARAMVAAGARDQEGRFVYEYEAITQLA